MHCRAVDTLKGHSRAVTVISFRAWGGPGSGPADLELCEDLRESLWRKPQQGREGGGGGGGILGSWDAG